MHEDHNAITGLVIHAFVNHAEQRIVIAVRGIGDPTLGGNLGHIGEGDALEDHRFHATGAGHAAVDRAARPRLYLGRRPRLYLRGAAPVCL